MARATVAELVEAADRACRRSVQLRAQSTVVLAQSCALVRDLPDDQGAGDRVSALRTRIADLESQLGRHAAIEQAKGIIIGATGRSDSEAFDMLVRQSQHENRKVHLVASDLVGSKVRPAHRPPSR